MGLPFPAAGYRPGSAGYKPAGTGYKPPPGSQRRSLGSSTYRARLPLGQPGLAGNFARPAAAAFTSAAAPSWWRTAARGISLGARFTPWGRVVFTAWEMSRWWLQMNRLWRYGRLNTAGWQLFSSCGIAPLFSGAGATQLCGTAVNVANTIRFAYQHNRLNSSISYYGQVAFLVGQWICRRAETWIRPSGNTTLTPVPHYAPRPQTRPMPMPQIDPFVPPYNVEPEPEPVPYPVIPRLRPNPYRAPNERPDRGNDPESHPNNQNRVKPRRIPRGVTWEVGSGDSEPLPNGRPRPIPKPRPSPNPLPARPPRGRPSKERKATAVTLSGTVIGRIVSGLTESGDLINAFWESIPLRYRAHYFDKDGVMRPIYVGFKQKLADVYEHWDKVSMSELAKNLALENFEDWAFGRMGQIGADAAAEFGDITGRPVGFQFGPLH